MKISAIVFLLAGVCGLVHVDAYGSFKQPPSRQTRSVGTVKPRGLKGEWEFCTSNNECQNGCCSDELTNEKKKRCTPNLCSHLQAGKKDKWQRCSASDECANMCCAKFNSNDGQMRCTPGGACE